MRFLVLVLSLSLCTAAPAAEAPLRTQSAGVPAPPPGERLGREWADFLAALTDYTQATHRQALAELERLLEELDGRIEAARRDLALRWGALSDETRSRVEQALAELERSRRELARWSARMRHAGAEGWERLRRGLTQAYAAVERALEALVERGAPPSPAAPEAADPLRAVPI